MEARPCRPEAGEERLVWRSGETQRAEPAGQVPSPCPQEFEFAR